MMEAQTSASGTDAPGSQLFNQSLEKGLAVLAAFSASRRTMTIAEIAEVAGINKSSAQRMVFTLEQLGYLRKHPQTRRYQLTLQVMKVGYNYLAADPLIDVANPFLSELTKVTAETKKTMGDAFAILYKYGWPVVTAFALLAFLFPGRVRRAETGASVAPTTQR